LFGGLAGEFFEVAADFDDDAGDGGFPGAEFGEDVVQETVKNEQAVADEVVVSEFVERAVVLEFAGAGIWVEEGIEDAVGGLFLTFGMGGGFGGFGRIVAGEDFIADLAENGTCVGGAAAGDFGSDFRLDEVGVEVAKRELAFFGFEGGEAFFEGGEELGVIAGFLENKGKGGGFSGEPELDDFAPDGFREVFPEGVESRGWGILGFADFVHDGVEDECFFAIGVDFEIGVDVGGDGAAVGFDFAFEVFVGEAALFFGELEQGGAEFFVERFTVGFDVGEDAGKPVFEEFFGFGGRNFGKFFGLFAGLSFRFSGGDLVIVDFGPSDGAAGDDAVVETRDELAEEETAVVALGESDIGGC